MKKIISLALAASIVLSFSNLTVLAFDESTEQDDTVVSDHDDESNVETSVDSADDSSEDEEIDESVVLESDDSTDLETAVEEAFSDPVVVEEVSDVSDSLWDGQTTDSIFENDLLRVSFVLDSYWDGGFNATVTLENVSHETIENWCIYMYYSGSINNIWNAAVEETLEDGYKIRNAGWNQDIEPGKAVSFGLSGTEDFVGFPSDYSLIGSISRVSDEAFIAEYSLYTDWNDGFSAELSLTNTSEETIEDWILDFDYDRNITEIWNGEIISHEGNHYTIKNCGYNANIITQQTVIIGFNGIDGESDDVPYNISLRSSVFENNIINDDEMIVMSVYQDVNVQYYDGDEPLCVKHNVILPTDFELVEVVWESDRCDIVDTDGTVHRSYSESPLVNLKATISLNDFSIEKTFQLRVIKTMYDNYSLDNVFVIDEIDQLYFYNDIIEDTYFYENSNGYLNRVIGSISDIVVDSPDEALLALYGIKNVIGCDSVYDELVIDHIAKDDYGYVYCFSQLYNSIPVYGSSINVLTDLNGTIVGFNSNFKALNLNTDCSVSSDSAKSLISENVSTIDCNKIIYCNSNEANVAWYIEYYDAEGYICSVIVDAKSGSIISNHRMSMGVTTSAEDEDGVTQTIRVTEDESGYLQFRDSIRNISICSPEGTDYPVNNSWGPFEPEAVSVYVNACIAHDYYLNKYNISSFKMNDNLAEVKVVYGYELAGNPFSCYSVDGETIKLGKADTDNGYKSHGAYTELVSHEYTHGIIDALTELDKGYDDKEAGAVNEGYADVMGILISGKTDWIMQYPNGIIARNIPDPKSSEERPCASNYKDASFDRDYYGDYQNHGVKDLTHVNSTILSNACYRMYKAGLSYDVLSDLVFNSWRVGYGDDATFVTARLNFEQAAINMHLSDYQKQIISDAFDAVGVELDDNNKLHQSSTIVVSGKVVEAKPGIDISQYPALNGAQVSVKRSGYSTAYCDPVLTVNGLFSVNDLKYGKYVFVVSKTDYISASFEVNIRSRNDITLGILYMISTEFSGVGTSHGRVIDAVTGLPVPDMTVCVMDGNAQVNYDANSSSFRILETLTTDSNGRFSLKDYDAGQYTVVVRDDREGISNSDRYSSTYRGIVVFGGVYNSNNSIAISKLMDAGNIRIVLEWGANPSDLDSHLLFGGEKDLAYYFKQRSENGELYASLDRDDRDGYGPETTTIYKTKDNDGEYVFSVHQYSSYGSIASSNAKVSVFVGSVVYPKYTFYAPIDQSGRVWNVFSYDTKTKTIKPINIVSGSYVQPNN